MCRGSLFCSELDLDPLKWDKFCLLKRPDWMAHSIDEFVNAVDFFILGDIESCLKTLEKINSNEITNWYIEHGQMSGRHRYILLKKSDTISKIGRAHV